MTHTEIKQRLEQEEDRMRKQQALMLAELEEDNRKKLAEASLTELELSEDVLEASQSLQETFCEFNAQSQYAKSVRLTNWVTNASAEVASHFTHVQDSTNESQTRESKDRLLSNPSFIKAAVPTDLQKNLEQFVRITDFLTELPTEAATGIGIS